MDTTMTIPAGEAHAALSHHHRQREIRLERQAALVKLDLALLGQQLHWSVIGPGFGPLHLQLDERVAAGRELSGTAAERAVELDYWPDSQGGAVAETSGLEPVSRGAVDDRELVQLRASRLIGVVGRVRAPMDSLGWLDLASTDVLIGVVGVLEQQLWTVRVERAL